jgi:hypothetical protein
VAASAEHYALSAFINMMVTKQRCRWQCEGTADSAEVQHCYLNAESGILIQTPSFLADDAYYR